MGPRLEFSPAIPRKAWSRPAPPFLMLGPAGSAREALRGTPASAHVLLSGSGSQKGLPKTTPEEGEAMAVP